MPRHNSFQRFIRLAGPWPIEARYLGALTFFLIASYYSLENSANHQIFSRGVFLRPALSAALAAISWLQLTILSRATARYSENSFIYFSTLAFHSFVIWSWLVLFRNIFPDIKAGTTAFASPVPIIRFFFTYLCVNAIIGHSRQQLFKALAEKQETLKVVESQRTLLLESDEKMRRHLSEFLHDRVQSSLVTACLELQSVQKTLDGDERDEISKVIQKLETLRAVDVRNASQALTPPLGNADLSTSISVMAEQYAPQVKVTLHDDLALETLGEPGSKEVSLGIYRIIEQALLNAMIHGKATNAFIRITHSNSNFLIDITNDGLPLSENMKPGLGTAIINAWVRSLKGEWTISNSKDSHVTVSVILPAI